VTDLLASAWLVVMRHRLRSALAVVGVAVGVCALTSIISVENSWRRAVTAFFAKEDLETVLVQVPGAREWRARRYLKPGLDPDDARAITAECPAVESATFMTTWTEMLVEHEGYGVQVPVRAAEDTFCETLPDNVREGLLFTADEQAARAPVCVLSLQPRLFLFGDQQAVGRDIRIGPYRFQVVGVITGIGHLGIGPESIYVPATWARALLNVRQAGQPKKQIFARTHDPKAASAQIDRLLRRRIGGDASTSFTTSLWEVREMALHSRSRATFYSGLAALCALLAAAVGIAALLFVSVSERSRDIGIVRALGASRAWIYGEQVMAAFLLSGTGGVVGALAGIPASAAGAFVSRWQPLLPRHADILGHRSAQFPRMSEMAVTVSWEALAIAVALAILTGTAAALSPASEAAGLEPVQAIARRPGTARRVREVLTCLQVAFGVLVLVVLTSYFAVIQSEERAEARKRLGEDRVSASADPIAAMRKPVKERYRIACREALAQVLASAANLSALRAHTPLVKDVTPVVPVVLDIGWGPRAAEGVQVIFTTADFLRYGRELAAGDPGRVAEAFRSGSPAVVVDPTLKERLFGHRDPIGERLNVGGNKFTVAGVRERLNHHPNGTAWLPITYYEALKHRARRDWSAEFYLAETRVDSRPLDERQYVVALAQLRDALLPMLPEKYRKGIKFSEDIPATLREFILQNKGIAARGAVGAFAVLLVALIGLANMLLVSVHQEMHEIGVRRALGAQRPDILLHFVWEGVLLSTLGAAAGLGIGALICWATRSWADLPISVSMFWAVAGGVAAVVAGAIISLFPAMVAARIHPVEALRYE